jgi:hypothetical protein
MTNKSGWPWLLTVCCYFALNGCGEEESNEVQVDHMDQLDQ